MFKLLLVDDVKLIRVGIRSSLKTFPDLEIYEAGNVPEAIKVLEDENIDLMLLDLNLTKNITWCEKTDENCKDGLDLVREMEKLNIVRPKIVVLSGTVNETALLEAYSMGITSIISKPYNVEELQNLIRKLQNSER